MHKAMQDRARPSGLGAAPVHTARRRGRGRARRSGQAAGPGWARGPLQPRPPPFIARSTPRSAPLPPPGVLLATRAGSEACGGRPPPGRRDGAAERAGLAQTSAARNLAAPRPACPHTPPASPSPPRPGWGRARAPRPRSAAGRPLRFAPRRRGPGLTTHFLPRKLKRLSFSCGVSSRDPTLLTRRGCGGCC